MGTTMTEELLCGPKKKKLNIKLVKERQMDQILRDV